MKLVWTRAALADREAILLWLFKDNPGAAFALDERFDTAARSLTRFAERGVPGAVAGTREIFPTPITG